MRYDREIVANRIRTMRAAHGLTQSDLAKRIDKSVDSLKIYEAGNGSISLDTAVALADVLGITLEQLAGREPLVIESFPLRDGEAS